jgi:allophanate hydrolase subunit 2
LAVFALSLAFASTGSNIAARIDMMAMTTNISINVNAQEFLQLTPCKSFF